MRRQQWVLGIAAGVFMGLLVYYGVFPYASRAYRYLTREEFPPSEVECSLDESEEVFRDGNAASARGDTDSAEELFSLAAAYNGRYTLMLAKVFDPTRRGLDPLTDARSYSELYLRRR